MRARGHRRLIVGKGQRRQHAGQVPRLAGSQGETRPLARESDALSGGLRHARLAQTRGLAPPALEVSSLGAGKAALILLGSAKPRLSVAAHSSRPTARRPPLSPARPLLRLKQRY